MSVKLPKIERDDSALEEAVGPLVEASTTESWKAVLSILYLNGSVLCMSDEVPIPVVVSIDGDPDEVWETIELLEAKFTTAISPLISAGAKKFVPGILQDLKVGIADSKITIDDEAAIQAFIIGHFTQILESRDNPLNRLLVQGAFRFGEVVAASVFDMLARLWRGLVQSTLEEVDYEELIEGLRKLGLIESKLQVSICSNCANYQLVVSKFLGESEECPKCGESWTTARLYTFVPTYEKVKLGNKDLSLFISSYLRYKVSELAPLATLDVRPNATLSSKGVRVEVDVYLPQFNTGIECKVFENPFAPMTTARLGSIQGPLVKQIRNYTSVGIKKIGIATNLPPEAIEKLKTALTRDVRRGSVAFEMVPGDVDDLIRWLDQLATSIAGEFNKGLQETVQKVVRTRPKSMRQSIGRVPSSPEVETTVTALT